MARYRSIPTFIEAFRVRQRTVVGPAQSGLQGLFVVFPGDYLCVDQQGHAFPCKAEDFARRFEPIEEPDP